MKRLDVARVSTAVQRLDTRATKPLAQAEAALHGAPMSAPTLATYQPNGSRFTQRRRRVFKPAGGFGSKAAYGGDKLTRAVWSDSVAGDFVAQASAPPGERLVAIDGGQVSCKMSVRLVTYAGNLVGGSPPLPRVNHELPDAGRRIVAGAVDRGGNGLSHQNQDLRPTTTLMWPTFSLSARAKRAVSPNVRLYSMPIYGANSFLIS